MTSATTTTTSVEAGLERYRKAERTLWGRYGLEPMERFIELDAPVVRLRVLEIGSVAMSRETGSKRNERAMVRTIAGTRGFRPELV